MVIKVPKIKDSYKSALCIRVIVSTLSATAIFLKKHIRNLRITKIKSWQKSFYLYIKENIWQTSKLFGLPLPE